MRTVPLDPDLLRPVGTAEGDDLDGHLRLVIDDDRRVLQATVLDPSSLRDPDALREALRGALAVADGARAAASLRQAGRLEEYLARAEETVAGRRPLRAPTPPSVTREASRRRREARRGEVPPSPPPPPAPATSGNGYLTVQRSVDGQLIGLEVDTAWLGAARPEHLERAIVEACDLGGAR